MTDNLVLAQGYDVSDGGSETIDVDSAKYSRIRVIAYTQSGTQARVKVVVRVTTVKDGGMLGNWNHFMWNLMVEQLPQYTISPGPHLQFILTRDSEKGTATGVFSVFGVVRVMLEPSNTVGPPAGTHSIGELHVDSNAVLYFCVGSGTPGKWKIVQLQE